MENKIHDFWKLNLDFIEGCKDCEFHIMFYSSLEENLTKKTLFKDTMFFK